MAWTAPRTWANGEIVTQTMLNTDHRDNLIELWHEVAYTEFTTSVALTTAFTDVVSSGAITYSAYPTFIEFYCPEVGTADTGGSYVQINLFDGATDIGILSRSAAITNGNSGAVYAYRRLTPTAASHTYKIRALTAAAGGANNIRAGTGGATAWMPGFIRVMQKGGA